MDLSGIMLSVRSGAKPTPGDECVSVDREPDDLGEAYEVPTT